MLFESIDLLCVWAFSHAPVARKLIVVSSRKCVYAAMPPLLLNLLEKSDWDSRLVYVTASLRDCICLPLYPGLLERADKGHSNCVRCIRSVFLSPTPVELPKRFLPLLYLFFILNKNLILRQYWDGCITCLAGKRGQTNKLFITTDATVDAGNGIINDILDSVEFLNDCWNQECVINIFSCEVESAYLSHLVLTVIIQSHFVSNCVTICSEYFSYRVPEAISWY